MTQTSYSYGAGQEDIRKDNHVQATHSEQVRLGKLSLEVSTALITRGTLQDMLTSCTEALVHHLDAAFARIWLLNEEEYVLELQACSGMDSNLEGVHARIPVGSPKIGLIAAEGKPYLTNTLIGDSCVCDQEWPKHEGIIAFAGYPLLIEDHVIGVIAIFARHSLNDVALQAMATIANGIALGIERLRVQEQLASMLVLEQRARTQVEADRQRLEMAQRIGHIGTFEWDITSNHILWTPELEALYGLPSGGFGGKYEHWVERIHPDDLKQAEESFQGAVASNSSYNVEFRVIWPDGTVRWILAKGDFFSYDVQNLPTRMLGVNIDITKRKEDEQQRIQMLQHIQDLNANLEITVAQRTAILHQLNTELQRSNQELQSFAYVASHDLQEPLRKIQAFGNLLEEEYGQALGEGKAYLDRMSNAAARMRILINDLLAFSRVTSKALPFSPVDLTAIAYEVLDDLESQVQTTQGTIEIRSLPTIEADLLQMRQMLQNLMGNALKFHHRERPPVLKVYAEVQPDPAALQELTEQQCVIFVQDNGIGFDEKYLDRIFTVFQRLHGKNDYEGTGIGLAVVRKIVERHGGTITARSAIEEGTTFIVKLPMRHTEKETK